jgi:type I restriction enzyme S subunit
MQLCQSYIQECKHKFPVVELGLYIEECNNRNKQLEFGEDDLMGVKSDGTFIMSIADKSELKFHNYKIVRKGEFSYSNRINIGSIAMNRIKDCIVSPSYAVFKVKDENKEIISPDYLDMWYRRGEFLRSTLFFAFGTIKDDFSIDNMKRSLIPLPPIEVQNAIVSLYQCALEYKKIAAEADAQSRSICSALMQHAINS